MLFFHWINSVNLLVPKLISLIPENLLGNLKRLLFLILPLTLLSSCRIDVSLAGLISYQEKVSSASPGLIKTPSDNICGLEQGSPPAVFAVNGKQIRSCLSELSQSIVYIWKPKCTGIACVSPDYIQQFCRQRKISLFIVAEYYDAELMNYQYKTDRPIFGVDCNFYNTAYTQRYMKRFLADLLPNSKGAETGSFYLFHKDSLIAHTVNLDSLSL